MELAPVIAYNSPEETWGFNEEFAKQTVQTVALGTSLEEPGMWGGRRKLCQRGTNIENMLKLVVLLVPTKRSREVSGRAWMYRAGWCPAKHNIVQIRV